MHEEGLSGADASAKPLKARLPSAPSRWSPTMSAYWARPLGGVICGGGLSRVNAGASERPG